MCISSLAEAIVEPVGIPLRSNETNKRRALKLLVMPTKLPAASLLSAKRPRGSSINDASALATMRISIAAAVGVAIGAGVAVTVGTGAGVGVLAGDGVLVGVTVGVLVGTRIRVGVSVAVGTGTGVAVAASVAVAVGLAVIGVGVARGANVAVGDSPPHAAVIRKTLIRMARKALTRILGNMGCLFSPRSAIGYYAHDS
jgi:hypothetical protein